MLGENNHQEDPHQQQNQANHDNQQHKNDNQHIENQEVHDTHQENQQNKQQENIQHNQHDNQEHQQKQEDLAKDGHHQLENEDLHKQRVVGELEQIAQALLNNQKNQSNQHTNQVENHPQQHQEENQQQKSDQNQQVEHKSDQKHQNLNDVQNNNEQVQHVQHVQKEKQQEQKHENHQEQKQQQESHHQEVSQDDQQKQVKYDEPQQEQHQQQKIVDDNHEQKEQDQIHPHQEDFQQNQQQNIEQDQHQRKEQQKLTFLESVQEALKGHEHDAFPIPQQAEKEVNDDNDDEDVEIKEEPNEEKFNQFETPTIGQFDENNSQKIQQEQEQQQIQQEQQQAKEENPNVLQYQRSLQEGINLKAQGNNFFSNRNYLDAIGVYSSALGLCQGYYMAQCPIELFPQFKQLQLQLLSNLAACYLELGFHNECITFSSQVLSIDPLNTKALYRRATAYQKKGNLEEAFRDIDQAFELNKKSPIEDQKINDKRMEIRYQLKQFQQEHKKDSQQMYQKMFSQSEKKTQSEQKQENQQQKLSQSEVLHKPQQQNIEIKQSFSYSNAVLKFVGSILISTAATKYIMEQKIESKQGIISQLVVGGSFLGIVQLRPTWQKMLAGAIGSGFIAFVLFQRKR
ncbi:hypothetical protein pb186bvf_009474 [Paramecium bursaria]